jgi:hypothetical protein
MVKVPSRGKTFLGDKGARKYMNVQDTIYLLGLVELFPSWGIGSILSTINDIY